MIVGASSMIAAASARELSRRGVQRFTLTYGSSGDKAYALGEELKRGGAHVQVERLKFPFDDVDEHRLANLFDSSADTMDVEVDMLLNAVALSPNVSFEEQTLDGPEGWRAVFETNLFSPFLLTRAFVRRARTQRTSASVVHIGSSNGDNSYADYSLPYDLAKGALAKMLSNMARTFTTKYHTRGNTVAPGWVATTASMDLADPKEKARELRRIFQKRYGTPEEIADMVATLFFNAYMNGQTVRIDGGYDRSES
jgi:NAD(P)-dependent dehydrogenase (short-subunit alcohol dehydrogenase family)